MGSKKRKKDKSEEINGTERKAVNTNKSSNEKPNKFSIDLNYSSDFPLSMT